MLCMSAAESQAWCTLYGLEGSGNVLCMSATDSQDLCTLYGLGGSGNELCMSAADSQHWYISCYLDWYRKHALNVIFQELRKDDVLLSN